MSDVYRIYGAELSPYSVKVRSYFRYKGIAHEWIVRSADKMEEFQRYAKLPLIPLVVTPDEEPLQDSTPILEEMEQRFPEPSIHPSDPALAFLSALIEEFADEWGNKWMFHYRWARPADQESAALRLAATIVPDVGAQQQGEIAEQIKSRMVDRVWFVGSNETNAPQIEDSFREFVEALDAHLADRLYLFGARPAMADFGLWGQIYNAWTDPTCRAIVESAGARIVPWLERMLEPGKQGDFEGWDTLDRTLAPILADYVGALFLPWSTANARAIASGEDRFTVPLRTGSWTQKPQKYHARSLATLKSRYAAVADKATLDPILLRTGCLEWLQP